MTTVTTAPATTDVPDTEQPDTWHAHRYLTAHGQPVQGCDDDCCTTTEEDDRA